MSDSATSWTVAHQASLSVTNSRSYPNSCASGRMPSSHLILCRPLLLLPPPSHFNRVWLCVTPETAAHQAPPPWYSPGIATAKSLQSCPTLCNPMDCSPPGSSAHGIFQARVLEWGAIAFSISRHWVYINVGLLKFCCHLPIKKQTNVLAHCRPHHPTTTPATVFKNQFVTYQEDFYGLYW